MSKMKWASVGEGVRWNRLRSVRKNAGLTIGELALRSGVNESHISRIENSKEGLIARGAKEKLARFFHLDYEDLFPSAMSGNEPIKRIFSNDLNQVVEEIVPYIDAVPALPTPAPAKKAKGAPKA